MADIWEQIKTMSNTELVNLHDELIEKIEKKLTRDEQFSLHVLLEAVYELTGREE